MDSLQLATCCFTMIKYYRSPYYVQKGHGVGVGGRLRRSPYIGPSAGLGSGRRYYSLPYYQKGHGLGSMFGSLARFLIPAVKSTLKSGAALSKSVLKSDAVKSVAKSIKDSAVEAGLDLAQTAIEGGDMRKNLGSNVHKGKTRVKKLLLSELNKKKRQLARSDTDDYDDDQDDAPPVRKKGKKKGRKRTKNVYIGRRPGPVKRRRRKPNDYLSSDSETE
jgi:hypothetical protein